MWLVRTTAGHNTKLLLNPGSLTVICLALEQSWSKLFKNNNQINSTVTVRPWALLTKWIRTWSSTGLISEWKNGGGRRLFEWWILFSRVRGYCILLTKTQAISLYLLWLFEGMFSMQFFWNIQRKANCPPIN